MAKTKKKIVYYEALLTTMGRKHTSKGKTMEEAIGKLDVGNIKGRAVLAIKHGKKTRERILNGAILFRLFSGSPLTREVAMKQMTLLFDDIQ